MVQAKTKIEMRKNTDIEIQNFSKIVPNTLFGQFFSLKSLLHENAIASCHAEYDCDYF